MVVVIKPNFIVPSLSIIAFLEVDELDWKRKDKNG